MNNIGFLAPTSHNPVKYKTVLCKHFKSSKGCSFGDKCQFAHGINELRSIPGGNQISQMKHQNKGTNAQNYKIVKCKYFEKDGTCRYGTLCSFAHGDKELRKKNDYIMNTPDIMMDPISMYINSPFISPQFNQTIMMNGMQGNIGIPGNMGGLLGKMGGIQGNLGGMPTNIPLGNMPLGNVLNDLSNNIEPPKEDSEIINNFNMFIMNQNMKKESSQSKEEKKEEEKDEKV